MKKNILTYVVISLYWLTGCEKIIELKDFGNSNPKLVIYAFLHPDSTLKVSVTKSIPILESYRIEYITNATVSVYEDNQKIGNLIYSSLNNFYYSTEIKPKKGRMYKIEVEAENFPTAYGETYIPIPVSIISVDSLSKKTSDN